MMKKFLSFLIPILTLMVCMPACDNDMDNPFRNYFYGINEKSEYKKITIEEIQDKAYVAYYPENEDKLRSELSKAGLDLKSGVWAEMFYGPAYNLTEEASGISPFYRKATVIGDYRKAKSAFSYSIGWSPYYKVVDKDALVSRNEIAFGICISAKLNDGVKESELLEFTKKYNIICVGEDTSLKGLYMLLVTNDSRESTLEISKKLVESGLCEYSDPDYLGKYWGWD